MDARTHSQLIPWSNLLHRDTNLSVKWHIWFSLFTSFLLDSLSTWQQPTLPFHHSEQIASAAFDLIHLNVLGSLPVLFPPDLLSFFLMNFLITHGKILWKVVRSYLTLILTLPQWLKLNSQNTPKKFLSYKALKQHAFLSTIKQYGTISQSSYLGTLQQVKPNVNSNTSWILFDLSSFLHQSLHPLQRSNTQCCLHH